MKSSASAVTQQIGVVLVDNQPGEAAGIADKKTGAGVIRQRQFP
jgi:hypothetical protein